MGLHRIRRPSLVLALVISGALLIGVTPAIGLDSAAALRAPSAEAKQACKKLKQKAQSLKGDARAKALRKYKKCLENYDAENPPVDGGGDGGTIDGGGTGVDPAPQQPTQCTDLANCPYLTRDDAAGQAKFDQGGGRLLLERASFGSSGSYAEYQRVFFYEDGSFKHYFVDWNSVSGESCRSEGRQVGSWSFAESYTYTANGGGVLVKVNITANGQSGNELLDFRNGSSSVYVGPKATRFDNNPHMADSC